jgi:hypothetical protein
MTEKKTKAKVTSNAGKVILKLHLSITLNLIWMD